MKRHLRNRPITLACNHPHPSQQPMALTAPISGGRYRCSLDVIGGLCFSSILLSVVLGDPTATDLAVTLGTVVNCDRLHGASQYCSRRRPSPRHYLPTKVPDAICRWSGGSLCGVHSSVHTVKQAEGVDWFSGWHASARLGLTLCQRNEGLKNSRYEVRVRLRLVERSITRHHNCRREIHLRRLEFSGSPAAKRQFLSRQTMPDGERSNKPARV